MQMIYSHNYATVLRPSNSFLMRDNHVIRPEAPNAPSGEDILQCYRETREKIDLTAVSSCLANEFN